MKNLLIWLTIIVVIGAGIFLSLNAYIYNEKQVDIPETASYFQERMVELGVSDIGQPIEGFDANLLMRAFPGLVPDDFEGVMTFEGHYVVEGDQVLFVRDKKQPTTSAEETVSEEGYGILLINTSQRLGLPIITESEVDTLIDVLDADHMAAGEEQWEQYTDEKTGFTFMYRKEPNGYILEESIQGEGENHVKTIVLMLESDYKALQQSTDAREGPPVISLQIFENVEKVQPGVWADRNSSISNVGLSLTDIEETVVAEANAVRYTADGLYPIDTVIIAHAGYIFMLSGSYLESSSAIREDFQPFIDSLSFIQGTRQE
jgi:hypothetical protein